MWRGRPRPRKVNVSENYLATGGNAHSFFAPGIANRFLADEAFCAEAKPLSNGDTLEFALAPGMRLLLGSVIVGLSGFSVLVFVYGIVKRDGWYGVFIPLAVLVAIQMATPRTVILDHGGIRQRRWLRGDRRIAWDEIKWMKRGSRTDTTYVKSKRGGRPISFPRVLVGRSVFEREIRKHAPEGTDLDE